MRSPGPDLIAILRRNVSRALMLRDFAEAEAALDRLKAEDPVSLHTRGLELELLLWSGRIDEAERLSRLLLDQYPASPRIHRLAGDLAFKRRDPKQAVEHLRESDRLHPHWRTRRALAQALTQAGEFDAAEALLLELLGEHPECRTALAWVHERQGRIEEAIRDLERRLQESPGDPRAKSHLLRLRAERLEPEDLLAEIERLLELAEELPAEILPRAFEVLLDQGQSSQARDLLARLKDRIDPRTALSIGWACYRRQAYDLAYEIFLEAVPREISNYKMLAALEAAARRFGRVPELAARYRALAPEHPRLWGHLRNLTRGMAE